MSITSEKQLPEAVAAWRDPEMDSVKGTETPKDPNKGYIALLGWSVNAIKAAQKFDRRYVVVAQNGQKISALPTTYLLYPGILSA